MAKQKIKPRAVIQRAAIQRVKTSTPVRRGAALNIGGLRQRQATDDTPSDIPYTVLTRKVLRQPVRGQGGYQTMLRRIKMLEDRVRGGDLSIDAEDMQKLARYATRYGEGGFQNRIRTLLSLYVAKQVKA